MKTLSKLLAATVFAIGCAGADLEQEDLGQMDQSLMSGYMGALQFGFRPDSEITCVWGNSAQTCIVPKSKKLRFFVTGGTSSQRNAAKTLAHSWYSAMVGAGLSQAADGWVFSEGTSVDDPEVTLIIDLDSGNGFCTGTGTDTQDYSCYTGSRANLTEDPGVFGSYQRWVATPVLHIDIDEIQSISGLTAAQKLNVTRQAVWSGLLRFVGVGLVTVGDNRCAKSSIVSSGSCFVTSAQACAAHSFGDAGNQAVWGFGGVDCGQ